MVRISHCWGIKRPKKQSKEQEITSCWQSKGMRISDYYFGLKWRRNKQYFFILLSQHIKFPILVSALAPVCLYSFSVWVGSSYKDILIAETQKWQHMMLHLLSFWPRKPQVVTYVVSWCWWMLVYESRQMEIELPPTYKNTNERRGRFRGKNTSSFSSNSRFFVLLCESSATQGKLWLLSR